MSITRPPHPETFCGDLADPPKALTPLCLMPNWLTWKWQRSTTNSSGWTKPPYRADDPSRHAKSDDPKTWNDRHIAVSAVLAGKANGIGFALTNTEVGAVDLDHCRDPKTGAIDAWAQKILDAAPNAYHEITVSGEGLRVIGIAAGPKTHRKLNVPDGRNGARIEIFRRATRYITVSGLEISHCAELPNIDQLINDVVAQYGDIEHQKANGDQQAGASNGIDDIDQIIRFGVPEGQRSEALLRVLFGLLPGKGFHKTR